MKNLTEEENNLIIEALLFASCVEISGDWDQEHINKMITLAASLKTENTKLNNVSVFIVNEEDLEQSAHTIMNEFKNVIPIVNYITEE